METNDKISVVINTYNASLYLDEVIKAVKTFDEIVVCDMESTDNTCDIARRHGCKVVTFPKGDYNICEPARQFAISQASYKWVLVVDADEIVSPELHDFLYDAISRSDCPAGYYVPRINKFMGMFVRDFTPDYQLRFFIKEGTVWPPYVHTFPVVQGRVEYIRQKTYMYHLMDETMHEYVDKMNQYTDNEVNKKSHKRYGIVALFWRPFWRFFRSYFLRGGFRMGTRGLIRALLAGWYQYVVVAKIMEKRYRDEEKNG